jgi:hypothetical protein
VERIDIKPIHQTTLNQVQQHLEQIRADTGSQTHHSSENGEHLSFTQALRDA